MVSREWKHGTASGYTYYGCRCGECREGHRLRMARRKAERLSGPVLGKHGLRSTYSNWGCRCEPCTKAHSEACVAYARERRARS